MEFFTFLFGEGENLNSLQAIMRAIGIFFIALLLLRIAGRRSFGMKAPFDNVLIILVGAILSRTVVGASPFSTTFWACFTIAVLHRLFSHLCYYFSSINSLFKGEKIPLFLNEKFIKKNLRRSQTTKDDILSQMRLLGYDENEMEKISAIYMEGNGRISVLRKK